MERNPEFYRPKGKDQACQPQPGYPDALMVDDKKHHSTVYRR